MDVHVRWMIRRDMPEVLAIEFGSFENWWSEDDFLRCLRQQRCIGCVAESAGRVVGFIVYELHKRRFHVVNFAVHPDHRRRGVGRQMAVWLKSKLSCGVNYANGRRAILLEVREKNLEAQLFWRQCGFRCSRILYDFYDDSSEAAYQMEFRSLELVSAELAGKE